MQKIAVVTDSSADLSIEFARKFNIHVVPLRVIYQHGEYRDGIDITPEDVVERLDQEIPTTSMPSPEDMARLFQQLEQDGFTHCIVIPVSPSLSGTYNTFRLMADDYSMKIDVIDSKGVSWIIGFLVLEAAKLVQENRHYQDILNRLEEVKERIKGIFIVDSLEYLQKGGRIGKVAAALGSMLNIKPIITFDQEGKLTPLTMARGKKQALKKMLEPITEQIKQAKASIAIVHSKAEQEAEALKKQLQEYENILHLHISSIGPALSVHAGPGLLGIVIKGEE
ncbi:fatty acid-binding protein DegV [Laceyella sacchari]|uniref:EDD domain protein, DegV family n=1 Tax=Laceyella tengchongensis TaxID=574699 RepID=A0AA45WJK1_9BACL|nr:DegV family protein [Laceyella tengchongensis]AUS08188.1 fatty acid-binding protein DegV [Laceyella sacchari]SMP03600.1 EDD domain protein, DegV family [Laceyella tengchongensis]